MRLLLVTPPMIQLNTPYPATAYLTGFLRCIPRSLASRFLRQTHRSPFGVRERAAIR